MGLERILAQHGVTADNLLEAERTGQWFDFPDGGVLLQLRPGTTLELELLVWMAVSTGPHGAYRRNLDAIIRIGKDLGAARLVFISKRRGWQRVARGWRRDGDRYTMELR